MVRAAGVGIQVQNARVQVSLESQERCQGIGATALYLVFLASSLLFPLYDNKD